MDRQCILCERTLPKRRWWQLCKPPPCCPPSDSFCKPIFMRRMQGKGLAVSIGSCGITHPHSPTSKCSGVSRA